MLAYTIRVVHVTEAVTVFTIIVVLKRSECVGNVARV